jgi:AcrR family transcriptional regulator
MPRSRRDDLIDAAMRVFYRHGFHASGLDSILEEGGISRMTLYNHFKSKDELIVAALRRRDEIFRNRMMKFVETKSENPYERLLAVFDFHEQWFAGRDFCGCMFINAAAEFSDPQCAARQVTAEHKRAIVRYLAELCRQCGFANPEHHAKQLNILIEGAIVSAQVVGLALDHGADPGASARLAREMARRVLEAAAEPQGRAEMRVSTRKPRSN